MKHFECKKILFSYLFSFINLLAFFISKNNDMSIHLLSKTLVISIFLSFIIYFIIDYLERIFRYLYLKKMNTSDKRFFIKCFIIIFILWFFVFLAYYPGLFAYDVQNQINQCINNRYSTYQPLIHTLILNYFYNMSSNHNIGIVMYSILQMLFLDFSICYSLLFIHRFTKSKINILYLLWYAILPIFSILSISITKDIYFSGFFLIFITTLFYFKKDENYLSNKKYILLFIISSIGTALFRNNGLYVVLFGNIFYIFSNFKNSKILFISLISIFLVLFLNNFLVLVTNANVGPKNEMLSIPYQQISRVYNYENIDKEEIERIIPNVKFYKPSISDPVKGRAKGFENKKEFITIYLKLFIRYPNRYLEAFINNNLGYIYVFDKTNANIYGSGLSNRQGYLLTDYKDGYQVFHKSYFSILEDIYEILFSANHYQDNYIIFLPFSFSFYFWILLYTIYKNLYKKNIDICLYVVFYIVTIFLGPCALVRYALPYICILPLFITMSYLENESV